MLIDDNFQAQPSGTHVPSDGSQIGGVDPTTPYAPIVLPNGALYSAIESAPVPGQYPTVMTYFDRPVLNPTGSSLTLDFDLYLGPGYPTSVNAVETDTILVTAGATPTTTVKRNLSLQNIRGQMYLILSNAWAAIPGATPGLFTQGARYHHTISYAFGPDSAAILSVAINDTVYEVPSSMQKADISASNWSPVAAMQLQQSLLPTGKGASFGLIFDKAMYTWPVA